MQMTAEARDALVIHTWPGNVRELSRALERAVTLAEANEIGLEHLPATVVGEHQQILTPSLQRQESLRTWGSRYARLTLERCRGNKREACRILGISYHTLQAYLRHAELMMAARAGDARESRCNQVREPNPG